MKLTYLNQGQAMRAFNVFMCLKYKYELGVPVIAELKEVRDELSERYGIEMDEISITDINDSIKFIAKLFMSDKECYTRIPSNKLVIACTYLKKEGIDKPNMQEYLVQNMEFYHRSDKIPEILCQLDNIDEIVDESVSKFENGIKYGQKHIIEHKEDSEAKKFYKRRQHEMYSDLTKGNK